MPSIYVFNHFKLVLGNAPSNPMASKRYLHYLIILLPGVVFHHNNLKRKEGKFGWHASIIHVTPTFNVHKKTLLVLFQVSR